MANKTECPKCGKYKKSWFPLCWECTSKENQKPKCEQCDTEVPEGHNLCKKHWMEMNEAKKKIKQVEFVQKKKEVEFKEKYEGMYYFNSQKVKSKSELLICYFLTANNIIFQYEPPIYFDNDKDRRPDFILKDEKNNHVILEHFGMNTEKYIKDKKEKIKLYDKFCKEHEGYYFIYTEEEDMKNLSEKLGKLIEKGTPIKRGIWK